MDEQKKKKKSTEISTILLSVFSILIISLGAAIYFVPGKYFINYEAEFDYSASQRLVVKKTAELKQFDLGIFKREKFTSLEKGYWHAFPEDDLIVGNKNPFVKESE
jgi:hypothetical protein